MGILPRYFLRRFLGAFAAALVILALAVAVVDTLLELDDMLEVAHTFGAMLLRIGLRLMTDALPYLVPIATFTAVFASVGLAARRNEVLAMKAGGISPLHIAAPVLAAALGIAVAHAAVSETLVVQAVHAREHFEEGGGPDLAFREGSFWYRRGRFVYNVDDADAEQRRLTGVRVFELDDRGRVVRMVHAARAAIEPAGDWVLENAAVRVFDPDRPDAPPAFEQLDHARVALSAEPGATLLRASVAELSIRDLRTYLASHPDGAGLAVTRARAFLHERVTDPLTVVLFALLALPLALRVERARTLALPALQGAVLLFVFHVVREAGSTLAMQGAAPAAATHWSILGAFGALGAWQLARVPR